MIGPGEISLFSPQPTGQDSGNVERQRKEEEKRRAVCTSDASCNRPRGTSGKGSPGEGASYELGALGLSLGQGYGPGRDRDPRFLSAQAKLSSWLLASRSDIATTPP